jgi:hypothetical protein
VGASFAILAGVVAAAIGMRALWRAAAVPMLGEWHEREKELAIEYAPDEYTRQMMIAAQEEARALGLKDMLPHASSDAIELVCRVEYSVAGELHKAAGRALLSQRLKTSGVVTLLFDPLAFDEVQLFAGLPADVSCAGGAWSPLPALPNALGLAIVALIAAAAVGGLCAELISLTPRGFAP